jgi:hypothetical protein
MIPYADLERALARWKARSRAGGTPDSAAPVAEQPPHETNGVPRSSELSGEIDINELVESYDE